MDFLGKVERVLKAAVRTAEDCIHSVLSPKSKKRRAEPEAEQEADSLPPAKRSDSRQRDAPGLGDDRILAPLPTNTTRRTEYGAPKETPFSKMGRFDWGNFAPRRSSGSTPLRHTLREEAPNGLLQRPQNQGLQSLLQSDSPHGSNPDMLRRGTSLHWKYEKQTALLHQNQHRPGPLQPPAQQPAPPQVSIHTAAPLQATPASGFGSSLHLSLDDRLMREIGSLGVERHLTKLDGMLQQSKAPADWDAGGEQLAAQMAELDLAKKKYEQAILQMKKAASKAKVELDHETAARREQELRQVNAAAVLD